MLVVYLHHIGVVSVHGRSGSLGSLHVRLIALLIPYAGITGEMEAGRMFRVRIQRVQRT